MEGWAVFIGVAFVISGVFHFLLEAYGRRAAWLTLFLAGFVPLFTSLVLISINNHWVHTARYLIGLSPLSAPWQPLQLLQQLEIAKLAEGKGMFRENFGPFALFGAVHVALFVVLFIAWLRTGCNGTYLNETKTEGLQLTQVHGILVESCSQTHRIPELQT